jgi:hypothetical protein
VQPFPGGLFEDGSTHPRRSVYRESRGKFVAKDEAVRDMLSVTKPGRSSMIGFLRILGIIVVVAVVAFFAIGLIASLPWWGIMSGLLTIGLVALWVATIVDVWRRADLSPLTAVIWTIVVLVLPLLGVLIYFFTRSSGADVQYRGETIS